MYRALVIDQDAANRLNLSALAEDWFGSFALPESVAGLRRIELQGVLYLLDQNARPDARLLIISGRGHLFFPELPQDARLECFSRILRVALSQFQRGINIPIDWRTYHSGSLVSFQSNRWASRLNSRVYIDLSPEGTNHIYAFSIVNSTNAPLTRAGFDAGLFEDAVLLYADALERAAPSATAEAVETSVALTRNFSDSNITQGVPYSVWRDSKLTVEQLRFFGAPFQGPLRVRGAAGTGKTVVLTMRFLKEIYERLDAVPRQPIRAAFVAHGQETADHIRNYLMLIDERNLLFDPPDQLDMQITTLHGIASEFINVDSETVQPLSLDGSEGRILQFELVTSLTRDFVSSAGAKMVDACGQNFRDALMAPPGSDPSKAFSIDLIDEFANVLEALGTREVDEIADKYIRMAPGPRGLGQTAAEKQIVLELYRAFRSELAEMGVVSLDQFISDFMRYLQSFRWEAIRSRRGFDFVFADELHLFNRQERPVLGFLLKDARAPRVAIAYDPRQSPRNSFFPEARRDRDNIWAEARLEAGSQQFELTTVFRYTPQIAAFMEQLNLHFPANDLSEEWELPKFSVSGSAKGPMPKALLFLGDVRMNPGAARFKLDKESVGVRMAQAAANRAKELTNRSKRGERVAVLCLDPDRFLVYREASAFHDDFIVVSSRDEIGLIQRHPRRAILSMPEYVAGLQFDSVLLLDANAMLIAQLGSGLNGLQRFISGVYLGASRAKRLLEIYADASSGGFAQPVRDAIEKGLADLVERD